MQFATPEAYLGSLIRRLTAVDIATSFLDGSKREGFVGDLRSARRDCQMTRLLFDHTVVAVAGDQGAGKTTLVRTLYDLDTTWLCDNAGRGERVPVLVLEDSDVTAPQGAIYRSLDESEEGKLLREPISAADFRKACVTWSADVLQLPVLRVPPRYFSGFNCGFLLLPGYEKITVGNREWQEFMRMALVASRACVLVTNEGLLAQQQDAIVSDLQKNQLAGVEPVIAITNTETMSEEKRDGLRASAARRFGVSIDCTVCSGARQEDAHIWRETLFAALQQFGGVGPSARERQLEDLEQLSEKIGNVVSESRQAVRSSRGLQSEDEELRQDIMDALQDQILDLRLDYLDVMTRSLNDIAGSAVEAAISDFDDNETGWSGTYRKAKDFVLRESHKQDIRMRSRLRSAVSRHGGGGAFGPTHAKLLANMSKKHLHLHHAAEDTPGKLLQVSSGVVATAEPEAMGLLTDHSLAALKSMLSVRRENPAALDRNAAKELKQVVKFLPSIACGWMSAMQTVVVSATPDGEMPRSDTQSMLQEIANKSTEMNGLTKGVLKAVGGLLLVDVAVDGHIDSIPALADAILKLVKGPDATIGASAAAAVGGLAAAVAGAGIAYTVVSTLDRQDADTRSRITQAIYGAMEKQKVEHLAHFDRVMGAMKRRVSDQLEIVLRLDESLGNRFRATLAIDDLRETRTSFLEEMRARTA